jgi:hypothetical protein
MKSAARDLYHIDVALLGLAWTRDHAGARRNDHAVIIGAIAAIPSGSIPSRIVAGRQHWPVPEARERRPAAAPVPQAQRPEPAAGGIASAPAEPTRTIAPTPPKPVEAAEWLEAITYALFALVGLAAFATLLLWRALAQWRRSADALQALAARDARS